MKNKGFKRMAIAASMMAFSAAHAADGTINFTGKITATTCNISGAGGAGKDFTVTLPTVSTTALGAAGTTTGETQFAISLSGCSATTGNVHVFFDGGSNTDAASGRLNVDAGAGKASNVQIALLNGSDRSEIKIGSPDASQNSKSVALASGSATFNYIARYYATGQATAGDVTSKAYYSIVYE